MGVKNHYYHTKYFNRFHDRFRGHLENEYQLIETTYTKRIKIGNNNYFFNNDGDMDLNVLRLINAVRNDAKRYLSDPRNKPRDTYINFFKLIQNPLPNKVVAKIDLTSAYWKMSCNMGIVSMQTDELLKTLFDDKQYNEFEMMFGDSKKKVYEDFKKARLKALGSLSTSKHVKHCKGKIIVDEYVTTEPTKPLYLEICRCVDEIMSESGQKLDGAIYYYWDCIFIYKEFEKQAIDFFRERGFETKSEDTMLEYVPIKNGSGYILSHCDGKIYMTRKEDKHLIPQYDEME